MDRRLINEDLQWLNKMRDANQSRGAIPYQVALKLKQLGYVADSGGAFAITLRGRNELIDRDREKLFNS